jgi:hypothetical protein
MFLQFFYVCHDNLRQYLKVKKSLYIKFCPKPQPLGVATGEDFFRGASIFKAYRTLA